MCQKVLRLAKRWEEKFPEIRPKLPSSNKPWWFHGWPWSGPWSTVAPICHTNYMVSWTPCLIKQAAQCSSLVWCLFEPISFLFFFEVNLGYCLPHLIDQLGVNWAWFFWLEPLTLGQRIGLVTWWYPIRRCCLSWHGHMIVRRHALRVFKLCVCALGVSNT